MQLKLNWGQGGIMTSVICAIHCALLPLIITSLPVLGVNIIHNAYFEWGMIFWPMRWVPYSCIMDLSGTIANGPR